MPMSTEDHLICPKCQGNRFEMKKEARYLYTYKLDIPLASNWNRQDEPLPFQFHTRDKLSSCEYLQCKDCGECYSSNFDKNLVRGELTILQKAVRSPYTSEPEFLG